MVVGCYINFIYTSLPFIFIGFSSFTFAAMLSYFQNNLMFISSAEQPYDSIPNFSAADALRLTGIGRNEFIDIMNKCRSKV